MERKEAAERQLGRVAGLLQKDKWGIPGVKEEVRDVLAEVSKETVSAMPSRDQVKKFLGSANYWIGRKNKDKVNGFVGQALKAIKGETGPVKPPPEEEKQPPPEEEKPPPEEQPSGGPPGNWKTVVEDNFPTKSPFDWGNDNNPAPKLEGDAAVFHLEPGGERCEMGLSTSNPYRSLKEGQELMFEMEMEFIHLPYTTQGHYTTFQFKGLESGDGSPNFALEPKNGPEGGLGLYVAEKGDLHGGGGDTVQFLAKDAEINGKRVLIQIPFKVSKKKQGYFEIWVNGTKRAERRNCNTLQTISAFGFIKFGIYRAKANGPSDTKVRNARIKVPA